MPQFVPDAFSPFTVDVPEDWKTAGHLKEHIIGMVCKRSGVYLISCLTGSQGCRCPDNMPFETTLLQSVTGKSLNLWLNLWTGILHRRSRAIGRLDRHHRSSRADLHRRHSVMAKDRPTIQ